MSTFTFLSLKLRFVGRRWLESGRAVEYVNSKEKAVDLAPLMTSLDGVVRGRRGTHCVFTRAVDEALDEGDDGAIDDALGVELQDVVVVRCRSPRPLVVRTARRHRQAFDAPAKCNRFLSRYVSRNCFAVRKQTEERWDRCS